MFSLYNQPEGCICCGDIMMMHIRAYNNNIFRREMMIEFLDKHCEEANEKEKDEESPISAYDFFYLPIDFM